MPSKTVPGADTEPMLPPLPPNYRGMIYEIARRTEGEVYAEGINRLVGEDDTYAERGRARRRREDVERKAFNHLMPPLPEKKDNGGRTSLSAGLGKLVSGLKEKSFEPEDILICAMIMLMLNSNSEDDILMVLVLMMLL